MSDRKRKIWGCRVDTREVQYINEQVVSHSVLRQGWGYHEHHDLSQFLNRPENSRNRSMYEKVKKGDWVLVPRIPEWHLVSVLEATEDWDKGYSFSIDAGVNDYGHRFPVKRLKTFHRKNQHVDGRIRTTLKCRSRFWQIRTSDESIEKIVAAEGVEKATSFDSTLNAVVSGAFQEAFNTQQFRDELFTRVTRSFAEKQWENVIQTVVDTLFPQYVVDVVQGKTEAKHGTDVLVKLPSIIGDEYYGVAIQVKDYSNQHDKIKLKQSIQRAINQVQKSDSYWVGDASDNVTLVDKYVVFSEIRRKGNENLIDDTQGVKLLFAEDVKELITRYAMATLKESEFSDESLVA